MPRYASPFPNDISSLIARYEFQDIDKAIADIALGYAPDGIKNETPFREGKRNLIIKTANHPWEILSVASLTQFFPTDETEILFFMPKGYAFLRPQDFPYNVTEIADTKSLLEYVKAANPENIYLQVSPHVNSEYLVILFHYFFFDANLIVEFYDMGCFFSDEIHRNTRNFSDKNILESNLGNWISLTKAKAVVVKSGGQAWQDFSQKSTVPCYTIYPMLDDETLLAAGEFAEKKWSPASDVRVLYAGSVTSSELRNGSKISPGANFLRYFEAMFQTDDVQLSIYNAAHKSDADSENPKFSVLVDWLSDFGDKVTYHKSIPQHKLLEIQASHDLGFFCVHYEEDPVEHIGRIAIPNRVMSYLCTGMPVIVDIYAEFIAELVESYNAGILIDPANPEEIGEKLRRADLPLLRQGAVKLRQDLVAHNSRELDRLKKLVVVS